jgi:hypothetical protein
VGKPLSRFRKCEANMADAFQLFFAHSAFLFQYGVTGLTIII